MTTKVLVPPLGQTVDAVTLVAWHKEEGDAVEQGEMLFAIETDKATLDIEAPAAGVLCQVTARPGDEVQVLSAIAVIAAPDESVASKQPDREQQTTASSATGELPQRQPRPISDRILISPRARRVAQEHRLSLALLKPTGPEGAIIERDVRAYLDVQVQSKALPGGDAVARDAGLAQPSRARPAPRAQIVREDAPGTLRNGERVTRTVAPAAHVTLNAEADATALVGLRRRLAGDGVEISYNALLLHILGRALRDHPRLNASLVNDSIEVWEEVSVGLAVDSVRGLLVPVIPDVDHKGLAQLEDESRSLIERARAGQCAPEELSGETFTLTNLGTYGIDSFTPGMNLPECAMLGVGRIRTQPAMIGGQVVARQMMWLSLSFDQRLVEGAAAARFLQRVVQLIEHPYLLLS